MATVIQAAAALDPAFRQPCGLPPSCSASSGGWCAWGTVPDHQTFEQGHYCNNMMLEPEQEPFDGMQLDEALNGLGADALPPLNDEEQLVAQQDQETSMLEDFTMTSHGEQNSPVFDWFYSISEFPEDSAINAIGSCESTIQATGSQASIDRCAAKIVGQPITKKVTFGQDCDVRTFCRDISNPDTPEYAQLSSGEDSKCILKTYDGPNPASIECDRLVRAFFEYRTTTEQHLRAVLGSEASKSIAEQAGTIASKLHRLADELSAATGQSHIGMLPSNCRLDSRHSAGVRQLAMWVQPS